MNKNDEKYRRIEYNCASDVNEIAIGGKSA